MRTVQLHQLAVHLFALSNKEEIDKIRERLRITGTRPARNHQLGQSLPFRCQKRHSRQIQHVQNIGIAQLILQRKPDDIKILDGVAAFQCVERNVLLTHESFHIRPGRKDTFAPYALHPVQAAIQNLHAKVRHADFINIGEAKCKANINGSFVLDNTVELSPYISSWFLNF